MPLHWNLDTDDYESLIAVVGTFNAMTEEGVEVVADPDDFTPLVWAALNSGNPVVIDMPLIGQGSNVVEVRVQFAGDVINSPLFQWCVDRLNDARLEGAVDRDVSDAVIKREARRLETQMHMLASSYIDNEFNEQE